MALNSIFLTLTNWPCDSGKEWCYYFVLGPNTDEQLLSKKASVIGQVEKLSPAEKHRHKGILES